jgi:hypothetical protein
VKWDDPAKFTEIRQSTNRFEAERGDWVQQLASYVQTTAAKPLQPGQTLDVTLVDIKRAGDYEPWHGPRGSDIRIMRDIYPPRITLQYTLKDASGRIVERGRRPPQRHRLPAQPGAEERQRSAALREAPDR